MRTAKRYEKKHEILTPILFYVNCIINLLSIYRRQHFTFCLPSCFLCCPLLLTPVISSRMKKVSQRDCFLTLNNLHGSLEILQFPLQFFVTPFPLRQNNVCFFYCCCLRGIFVLFFVLFCFLFCFVSLFLFLFAIQGASKRNKQFQNYIYKPI